MILILVLVFSCAVRAGAAGTVKVQLQAEYKYTEARKMLKMINGLRTGDRKSTRLNSSH